MLDATKTCDEFDGRVRLVPLREVAEPRGRLIECDFAWMPFVPRRTFIIDGVPMGTARGGHAHRDCDQLLLCTRGRVAVELALGSRRSEISLEGARVALFVGAGVWARQRYEEDGTVLVVFASLPFDPGSYMSHPAAK